MPIAGLLTCLFIGYIVKPKTVEEEIRLSGPFKGKALYNVMVKYVSPVFMVVILISSVIGYV